MDQQAHYWVWMKRRQILNSIKDSWEEKAFMEDASGQLGGCIWPPRSYSCSFCRREFRSAQALGGHMNVHRRDRARLKQSLGPFDDNNDPFQPQSNHVPSSTTHLRSLEFHFSPEIRTLGCDLDLTSSVSLSSSRVSALSTQESFNDHHGTIASPFSSSSSSNKVQQHPKGYPNSTYKLTGSDSNDPEAEKIINPRGEGITNSSKNSFTGADLFMGFNSTSCQNPTTGSCGDHEAISTCKRLKTAVSTLSLLMNPCSNDRGSLQSGGSSSVDEIDLELRLGEPPKVK